MSQNPNHVSWTNLNYKPADRTKIRVRIVLEGISMATWDPIIRIQWGRFSRNRRKNCRNDHYHRFRKSDDVREFMPTQQFFESPFRGISRIFRAYFIFHLTILNSEPSIV